jgi:hypothetical protein
MTNGEPQPSREPSMIAPVSVPMKAASPTWPAGSSRRGCCARDSGAISWVPMMARIPSGTLNQKIARHPTAAISAPPAIGPSAIPRPAAALQTPVARARAARSGSALAMIASATGLSAEAPAA